MNTTKEKNKENISLISAITILEGELFNKDCENSDPNLDDDEKMLNSYVIKSITKALDILRKENKKFNQPYIKEIKEIFKTYSSFRILEENVGLTHQGCIDNHTKRVFFGVKYNGHLDFNSTNFVDKYISLKSPIIEVLQGSSSDNTFLFSIPINIFINDDVKKSFREEINFLYK
ncbi:hypothetical protein SAMN04489761_3463 [Tenacibaculum sp. MAR_2009_124]|uniref:hypothetical protein n=1 Tax=Tenacibaculum sp. MAR_2009_124 TaxID=1250059 RepID=UPI00089609D4|nr:hypothetical protein [Tenacibaculum sp. MAR_2009_124]SEC67230.1 hypothetical protein SAMN04489761_3463 [Tenacibaculum sp. MAR_2009_124]